MQSLAWIAALICGACATGERFRSGSADAGAESELGVGSGDHQGGSPGATAGEEQSAAQGQGAAQGAEAQGASDDGANDDGANDDGANDDGANDDAFSGVNGANADLTAGVADATSGVSELVPAQQPPNPDDCGDGVLDGAEQCDLGAGNSDSVADGCRSDCRLARCGDGVRDSGEECDGDAACGVDCLLISCGNDRVEDSEECDPPLDGSCDERCRKIECGNMRIDEGEECEPKGVGNCDAECRLVACGNGRVDEGEECEPPGQGMCTGSCVLVACGNGRVDEGEGCEPPGQSGCSADCRVAGCGDGALEQGEECDPPASGQCDGQCRVIACGNGRVDEGEECDDDSASCDAQCRRIQCGNARIEQGEQCDPPSSMECSAACQRIECGDGRLDPGELCEPSFGNCTSACVPLDDHGAETLYGFDADVQGWGLYATSPEQLEAGTDVRYDAQNGDVTPGALRMSAPFSGSNQKIEVQVTISPPLDLRGRVITARVRLASGLSSDVNNPGGVKLFAKAGDKYDYASGEWAELRSGQGWVDVTLVVDAPVLIPGSWSGEAVRQIGLELRTFSETTQVSPAVVYVDSVTLN